MQDAVRAPGRAKRAKRDTRARKDFKDFGAFSREKGISIRRT
jgi:hypothetical protein